MKFILVVSSVMLSLSTFAQDAIQDIKGNTKANEIETRVKSLLESKEFKCPDGSKKVELPIKNYSGGISQAYIARANSNNFVVVRPSRGQVYVSAFLCPVKKKQLDPSQGKEIEVDLQALVTEYSGFHLEESPECEFGKITGAKVGVKWEKTFGIANYEFKSDLSYNQCDFSQPQKKPKANSSGNSISQ